MDAIELQRKNQKKQREESLREQLRIQEQLRPVHIQDAYNKENLEIQRKHNLEIFEKQAALTREIQEAQGKLLKKLSWRAVIATLLAVIIGAVLGVYLDRCGLKQPPKRAIVPTERQNTSVLPPQSEKATVKDTKPAESGVSSSRKFP